MYYFPKSYLYFLLALEAILVKFKSLMTSLSAFLFICGIAEFILLLLKSKSSGAAIVMEVICIISIVMFFIIDLLEFVGTRKIRKLAYPLITIYLFIGLPAISQYIYNKLLNLCLTIFSVIITMAFCYKDIIITKKENKLPH